MIQDADGYRPIDCAFHDVLESLATTGQPARVEFINVHGMPQSRTARLLDVFSRSGAEYLVLSTGETLRLDRLVAVDDSRLADF